jgi:peptidyl-prolyl cis-trans isomerase A (cyclophilin A)
MSPSQLARSFVLSLFASVLALPAFAAGPQVLIQTSLGDITVTLDEARAPQTVANFLAYVDDGFYDGTVFHRVIPDFMIQGGGLTPDLEKKETREPVENEAKNGLKNERGTIAMARTSAPHSATAQFFINHRDNDNLDYPSFDGWGYAVFGRVSDGMDVVDAIAAVETGTRAGRRDVPRETVTIETIRRVDAEAAGATP